jgi:hypothetical protein
LIALVAVGFAGCLSVSQRREDVLVENARAFNDDFRWGRWETLAGSMVRDEGAAFLRRVQALEDELVMADYQVSSITFLENGEAAAVVARFEWYLQRDPVVRHTTLEQLWKYQDGRWAVAKMRRTRGDRFGLVTEPATPLPANPDKAAVPAASGTPP